MRTEQPKPSNESDLETFWKAVRPRRRGGRTHKALMLGRIFGRLTVVAGAGVDKHGASLWRCQCVCGAEKVVPRGALKSGRVKSCGCLLSEYKRSPKRHLGHKPKGWEEPVDPQETQRALSRLQRDLQESALLSRRLY